MIKTKKLLVEGDTEVRVIPYLMEQNGVTWVVEDQPVVHIEPQGGVEEIMKPEVISSELKATGIEALGVLVDADEDAGNSVGTHKIYARTRYQDCQIKYQMKV